MRSAATSVGWACRCARSRAPPRRQLVFDQRRRRPPQARIVGSRLHVVGARLIGSGSIAAASRRSASRRQASARRVQLHGAAQRRHGILRLAGLGRAMPSSRCTGAECGCSRASGSSTSSAACAARHGDAPRPAPGAPRMTGHDLRISRACCAASRVLLEQTRGMRQRHVHRPQGLRDTSQPAPCASPTIVISL